MKKLVSKLRNNKPLKIIYNLLKGIVTIILLLALAVIIIQRVTNNELALGGYRIYTVVTPSMTPEYKIGDILISKEVDPNEIKIGDDVVYLGKEGDFEEKIVTHGVFSLREKQIPYDTVISGETSYSYDEEEDTFEFRYTIVLVDGSELDISDFGPNGATYIDRMLQKYGVATAYGTVDADTYEQMKSVCDENTMKFVDQCFTVNNR